MTKYLRNFLIGYLVLVLGIFVGAKIVFANDFNPVTIGKSYQFNRSALGCRTLARAELALDELEKTVWSIWRQQFLLNAKNGFCLNGRVKFILLSVVEDDDGNYKTWTDSDGDTWRILRVYPLSFSQSLLEYLFKLNGEPVIYLISPNPILKEGEAPLGVRAMKATSNVYIQVG